MEGSNRLVDGTLIDAVIAVARANGPRWAELRQVACQFTNYETDYATEQFFKEWFVPHGYLRRVSERIDGLVRSFIIDLFNEAISGRCRISGFVGANEIIIPPGVFGSGRFLKSVWTDGDGFWDQELRLPDGTLVVGVKVIWGQSEPDPVPSERVQAAIDWLLAKAEEIDRKLTREDFREECCQKTKATSREYNSAYKDPQLATYRRKVRS